MDRITIFHYHLLPGGVTNVILLGARSLIRYFPELKELIIVCGNPENTENIASRIKEEINTCRKHTHKIDFRICIEPLIGYTEAGESCLADEAERVKLKLLEEYSGSFWWIHNYQLGKNPMFTSAIMMISDNHPEQKMLLQIHDFPECARYSNLRKLFDVGITNPYPSGVGTAYCLINSRDFRLLKEAGIPENKLFLLNNPVEENMSARRSDESSRKSVRDYIEKRMSVFPGIEPDADTVFYPVRSIRRKNILEAGLICAVSETPVNLIVSLPGVSAQESRYSNLCEDCFRSALIPGIWGSGTDSEPDTPSFPVIMDNCKLIISSSVQEGFGYMFIDAALRGIPLIARYLDILDGIKDIFRTESSCFYSSFRVPLTDRELLSLQNDYKRKLQSVSDFISEEAVFIIEKEISSSGKDGTMDFSFLSVEQQTDLLREAKSSQLLKNDVRELNSDIFSEFYQLLNMGNIDAAPGRDKFGLKNHAETLRNIINGINSNTAALPYTESRKKSVQQNLLDSFAKPEYMRLLYDFY